MGKKCRNRKLYPFEQFTKESLLKAFELNEKNAYEKQLNSQRELFMSVIYTLSKDDSRQNGHYPLMLLEGQAKKEREIEEAKGRGLEWGR